MGRLSLVFLLALERGSALVATHVRGKVKKGSELFWPATVENAKKSIREAGIARFDVLKNGDEFLLMEVYEDDDAVLKHKETAHYETWRDAVAPSMAEPRAARALEPVFPKVWRCAPPPLDAGADDDDTTGLLVVVVDVDVTRGMEDAFVEATLANCRASCAEVGVARFDLLRERKTKDGSSSSKFALVEAYKDDDAPARHKATRHYAAWADAVRDMMASPRTSTKYRSAYPPRAYWDDTALERNDRLDLQEGGSFSFLAPKIAVGRGIAKTEISKALGDLGATAPFLVTGASGLERFGEDAFGGGDLFNTTYRVAGEPTVADAEQATELCRKAGCDAVVAIGGGSALDLGKAVAALATNLDDDNGVYAYLESVGEAKPLPNQTLPLVAVPTTSGTGSEATKNAVLKCEKKKRKASMRSDLMLPKVAIVDPSLTLTCPPAVTAHVGLDALCQLIEPFTSRFANPVVDALAREGIVRCSRSLRRAVLDGTDLAAREDMAVASLLGGLALANAKLGAVHGFASVLGGLYEKSPHGAICAALLAPVFRANVNRLEREANKDDDDDDDEAIVVQSSAAAKLVAAAKLDRFAEVGSLVTGNPEATPSDAADWLEGLVADLQVPKLRELCDIAEVTDDLVAEIVEATAKASSTKGNPVTLTSAELEGALRLAL